MALALKKDIMYCDVDSFLEAVDDIPPEHIRKIIEYFETQKFVNHQAVVNDEDGHIHGIVSRDWKVLQHQSIIDAMADNAVVIEKKIQLGDHESVMYALYSCDKFMEIPEDDIDLELLVAIRNGHGGKAKISTELWIYNRLYNQNWRLATGKVNTVRMNHTNADVDKFVDGIGDAIEVVQYRFDTHVVPRIKELSETPVDPDMILLGNKDAGTKSDFAGVIPIKVLELAEGIFQIEQPKNKWGLFQLLCRCITESCGLEPQRQHIVKLACEFGL